MKTLNALVTTVLIGGLASSGYAATQCFSQAGRYGSLTVTENGTGCNQLGWERYGIADWAVIANSNCDFGISPAVPRTNVTVRLGNINPGEAVSFSLNGSPYSVQAADLDNTTAPPTLPGTLSLTGNNVTGNASGGDNGGNGIVSFSSGPTLVSSITIAQSAPPGLGALLDVCVIEPQVIVATPVPTLAEWVKYILALVMVLSGGWFMRMRRKG